MSDVMSDVMSDLMSDGGPANDVDGTVTYGGRVAIWVLVGARREKSGGSFGEVAILRKCTSDHTQQEAVSRRRKG